MKEYSSPKEALLAAGRIKAITRGRISTENHAWLEAEIAAKRIRISGVKVVKSESKPVAVKAINGTTEKVIADITILWPEQSFKAVGNDGKEWSMRECCNTCRVSLVQNQCDHPTILGNIPVRIVPNVP